MFGFLYKRKEGKGLDFVSLKAGSQHLLLCTNCLFNTVYRFLAKRPYINYVQIFNETYTDFKDLRMLHFHL